MNSNAKNVRFKYSIILTIHNKDFLLEKVLNSLHKYSKGNFEYVFILDGCIDKSKIILENFLKILPKDKFQYCEVDNIFETKANNLGLKNSFSEYSVIVQDDMIIKEDNWLDQMNKPFETFNDVFAVTSRCAHDWKYNENSKDIHRDNYDGENWSDILIHCNHAEYKNTSRNTFAVRSSANRGPLMINNSDLVTLNYLDEKYCPQDMDDHDLMYRAYTKLKKICGAYHIKVESKNEWGGTRENGKPKQWLLKAQQTNTKRFYNTYKDLILKDNHSEDRKLKRKNSFYFF